jgi:hypothetical protein
VFCYALYCTLLQADVSAAVIAGLRADVAVANSIIADLKDVALDLRYAVVAVGDVAIKVNRSSTPCSLYCALALHSSISSYASA